MARSAAVQAAFDRIAPGLSRSHSRQRCPRRSSACAHAASLARTRRASTSAAAPAYSVLPLRDAGLKTLLDGIDLSPVMLGMARATGCYRHLERANLLLPDDCLRLAQPYDFAITMGLMGDYVPYYIALPHTVSALRPGAFVGYAVERRSTPSHALEKTRARSRPSPAVGNYVARARRQINRAGLSLLCRSTRVVTSSGFNGITELSEFTELGNGYDFQKTHPLSAIPLIPIIW